MARSCWSAPSRSARANQCGIARFDTDGVLDPGFGTGGRVLVGLSGGCFTVNQQSDGKLVVVGNDHVGDVSYGDVRCACCRQGRWIPASAPAACSHISSFGTPTRVAVTSSGNIVTGLRSRIRRTA